MRAAYGLDEILYAVRKKYSSENGNEFLSGGILILRKGRTILYADYYGAQNLTEHLEQFASMMEQL